MNEFAKAVQTSRQIGIRQRSLRRHCRLGRATELVLVLATGVTLVMADGAAAQTWDAGGGDSNWDTATNWDGDAVPGAGGVVIIDDGTLTFEPTLNVDSANLASTAISALTLTVDGTLNSPGVTLSGTGSLIINATRTVRGSSTADTAITMGSTGTLTNNGTIQGTLTITGGTTNNAGVVTGATTISGGILNLNAGSNLSDTAAFTVNGGTVNVNLGASPNNTETVGSLSGAGGTIDIDADRTLIVNQSVAGTFSGALAGSGSLTKQGSATLTLNGNSAGYGGNILVSAGAVRATSAGALGNTTGTTTVAAGAALEIAGGIAIGENITLNGTGVADGGALRNVSGDNVMSGTLTLGSAARIGSDAGEIDITGTITGTNTDLTLGGAGNMFVAGAITTGAGTLTKVGTGGLLLSGANTFTGATTVSGGFLQLVGGQTLSDTALLTVAAGALVAIDGNETVGNISGGGGIVLVGNRTLTAGNADDTTFSGVISETSAVMPGSFVKQGAGTLTLTGANTYTGTTTISAGTLQLGNGGATGALSGTTAIVNNAALLVNRSDALTMGNTISGTGTLTKMGTGTLTLSGANSYSGATAINGGAVLITNATALGTNAAGTSVAAGAALHLQGGITVAGEALSLDGTGLSGGGALRNVSGSNTWTGAVTLGSAASIVAATGSQLTISGGITGTNTTLTLGSIDTGTITLSGPITTGTGGLTKSGAGVATLSGANTYTGITTISGGTLRIANAAALGTTAGGTTVGAGATLQLDGGAGITVTGEALSLDGAGVASAGALNNLTGNNTWTGAVTLANAATVRTDGGGLTLSGPVNNGGFALTVTGAENTTISGAISGAGGLTKSGTGVLTLSGTNTHAGTTQVNDGRLVLAGGAAIPDAGLVNVTAGTVELQANETVGTLSGTGGALQLNTNTLTLAGTANSAFAGGVTGGIGSALVKNGGTTASFSGVFGMAGGTITVNAGTLVLSNGGNAIGQIVVAGATPTAATLRIAATGAAGGASGLIRATGSIIDYADGVVNATPVEIASNTTQFQVTTGTATQSGVVSEDVAPRPFEKIGAGTLILSAANTYTGATTVSAGTLALASAGAVSDVASTLVASGATLRLDANANVGALGNVAGAGGSVNLQVNTITVGSATANLTDTFAGVISGTGGLTKVGTGMQTLTGANTFSGATTINGGVLQIGAGGTTGTLGTGGVAINAPGALTFNRTNTLTTANVFTGDGTINQAGTGTTVLTGASGAFAGVANVNAGALRVDGTLGGAASQTNVNSTGTLQGSGTLGGNVTVASGGTLAAGAGAGSPGTLTIGGNLLLQAGSTARFDLGVPDLNSGADSDRINVTGALTLGGTLAVDTAVVNGYYRLFNAGGGVTGSFATSPGGATVLTNVTNQVNLRVGAAAPVQFWDGANLTDNNAVDGGTGTWNASNTNWTISNGQFNDAWLSGEGVFQGTAGTVTINGAQSFQGLTFNTAGYILNGPGTLVSPTAGGFSNLVANADATINAAITGPGGINKSGTGNLTLGGVNTHAGITDVAAGILTVNGSVTVSTIEVAGVGTLANNGTVQAVTNAGTFDNALGATAGAVANSNTATNAGTVASLSNTGGTFTNTGAITTTASVTGGTLANSGTVGGATTIGAAGTATNAGTMAAVGNAGSFDNSGGASALTNTGSATNSGTLASVANNAGSFISNAGTVTGTTTNSALMTVNGGTFTGGVTNIAGGTVNAQGAMSGNVTNAGTFTTAGALTGGGSAFTNTGTANIVAGSYTGLGSFANNAGTTTVTGQTLGATAITNAATLNVTGGTLTGTFGNTAGTTTFGGISTVNGATTNDAVIAALAGAATTFNGAVTNSGTMNLNLAGTTTVAGAFGGSGTVDMFGGAATGDQTLTFSGAAGSVGAHDWRMNYTSAGVGDRIRALGGQFGVGLQTFTFDLAGDFALGTEAVVVEGQTGLNRAFTVQGATLGGTVVYSLADIGGDTRLVAEANPGFGGIASGVSLTQAIIANVVNRPSSPFASGLVTEQGCSRGGYARGVFGRADASGTSSNGISTRPNSLSSSYAGVQGGFDVICNDGRFFNGWNGGAGALVGYNIGNTDQPVFGLGGTTVQTSTTKADFSQRYLGFYVVGNRDRLTVDAQVRFENTDYKMSETLAPGFVEGLGLQNDKFKTKGVNFTGRVSYNVEVNPDGLSFVPTAGLSMTRTGASRLTFSGNGNTLDLDSYTSKVGFVGGTLAQTRINEAGDAGSTYFVSANYYKEFGGDRTATLTTATPATTTRITSTDIGAFGELSLGWNYVRVLDNGPGGARQLNASVRADARRGSNISRSVSLTAQVRLSF